MPGTSPQTQRQFRARGFVASLSLLAALGLLLACGDEPLPTVPLPELPPPEEAVFETRLLNAAGLTGLASTRLALLEVRSWRFVSQGLTDANGFLRLDGLDDGEYVPVIYGSDAILLELPQASWPLSLGDTARVELRATRLPPDEAQVSGTVVDAVSGEPVEGAAIEMGTYSLAPERWGFTTLHRQVTDAEGRFALRGILIIKEDGEDIAFVPDLLCSAPGYRGLRRPFAFEELPSRNLRIELHPGTDTARLSGRVVDLGGEALVGVPLVLEWASRPEAFFKGEEAPAEPFIVLQGMSVRSGADGSYLFDGLPSGFYHILIGHGPRDGWMHIDGSGMPEYLTRPRFEITEGEQAQLGDIAAVATLHALAPAPGAIVGSQPAFEWDAWPFLGETWSPSYAVVIAPGGTRDRNQWIYLAPVPANHLAWPAPDRFLRPGVHAWRVEAFGGLASGYPLFESWARFEVQAPETAVSAPKSVNFQILRSETIPPVTPPAVRASESTDGR